MRLMVMVDGWMGGWLMACDVAWCLWKSNEVYVVLLCCMLMLDVGAWSLFPPEITRLN